MAESPTPPDDPQPAVTRPTSPGELLLSGIGIVYVAVGIVLGVAFVIGDVTTSLFPTGWILSAILVVSGALMTVRRRFDVAITLWAALTFAVFLIDMDVYLTGLELRLVDPAAFDATIITGLLALVVLILRPRFRD